MVVHSLWIYNVKGELIMDLLNNPVFWFWFFVLGIVSLGAFMVYDLKKEQHKKR